MSEPHPVRVVVTDDLKRSRLGVLFRWLLAIPAWIFAGVLGYALTLLAFGGWFVAIILGRLPRGMRDLSVYCLRFQTQTEAYSMLLTARYLSLTNP